MRKLERGDLIPALKERDEGKLLDYEYGALARALKQELDVTLLRAQDAHKIQMLMNMDTRERMQQQRPVQMADDQTNVQRVRSNLADVLDDVIVETEAGTSADELPAMPEAPAPTAESMADTFVTPATQGQGQGHGRVGAPTEASAPMAA